MNIVFLLASQTMTVPTLEIVILVFVMRLHAPQTLIVMKSGNVFKANAILQNAPMPGNVHIK